MIAPLLRRAALVLLCACWSVSAAADCSGRVVGVADGDTLEVLCDGVQTRVRLAQIDAPEYRQAYGRRARKELATLVDGRTVRLQAHGLDYYQRPLMTVWLAEVDVNREMVRRGYAWAYRRYLRDPSLLEDEAQARRERRGLWVEADPVPPWRFRPPPSAKRQAN